MSTADIFADMRRDQFTTQAFARDIRGFTVQPTSSDAVRWDAEGWLWHYASEHKLSHREFLDHREQLTKLATACGHSTIDAANDHLPWEFIKIIKASRQLTDDHTRCNWISTLR